MKRSLMAAIDLHSNNFLSGIVDAPGADMCSIKNFPGWARGWKSKRTLKSRPALDPDGD